MPYVLRKLVLISSRHKYERNLTGNCTMETRTTIWKKNIVCHYIIYLHSLLYVRWSHIQIRLYRSFLSITAHAVTNFIAYLSEPWSSRATIESKVITVWWVQFFCASDEETLLGMRFWDVQQNCYKSATNLHKYLVCNPERSTFLYGASVSKLQTCYKWGPFALQLLSDFAA